MRHRILVIAALVVASLLIAGAGIARYHQALADYIAPAPHSCGGG